MFDKLSRYETAAERSYYRAIHELQKIQKTNPSRDRLEAVTSDPEPAPNVIEHAPTPEFRSVPQNCPNPTHLDMEKANMRMSEAEFVSFLDEITAPPSLNFR